MEISEGEDGHVLCYHKIFCKGREGKLTPTHSLVSQLQHRLVINRSHLLPRPVVPRRRRPHGVHEDLPIDLLTRRRRIFHRHSLRLGLRLRRFVRAAARLFLLLKGLEVGRGPRLEPCCCCCCRCGRGRRRRHGVAVHGRPVDDGAVHADGHNNRRGGGRPRPAAGELGVQLWCASPAEAATRCCRAGAGGRDAFDEHDVHCLVVRAYCPSHEEESLSW